jgi:hypothetical protein
MTTLARLSAIYNWSTEGFDAPDLAAARALLTGLKPDASNA